MSGAAVNLSRLSRGIGEVKTNGHERVNVVFESEDYFNYALQRPYLPPVEPLYQLNEPPELSPRLSLHPDVQHKNIALPKTFTTRKGALLLFSEEFANKNQESDTKDYHHGQEHVLDGLDHVDLKTVDDFAKSVLAYGSGSGMSLIVKTVDSPRRYRPGFSARRYLSKLTRVYGDTFLDKLVTKGYISEKNIYEQNPVLPRLRHRINDDVSYPPAPYRLLKSMLRGPGLLSGYTFHMMHAEEDLSGDRGDLSTVVEEDEDKSTTVTTTKSRKLKSSSTVIKLKEKDASTTTLYTDLSHEDKGNVLTDLLVKSTISFALETQRKILLGEEELRKEEAELKSTKDSASQKSKDYNLNLAEAVRTYLESQVDEDVAGKPLRGAKLSEHSSRSYEATEDSGTNTGITDGESVHQRNWPETLGEREYIGNLPVATLREVVSSSTSAVSSRRSSIDKSPSVTGVPHRHQLHLNLSPIAGSREVTFKDAASPALQTPDGDSWRGHYREKFTKVPVIPPIGDKSSSPKASQGQEEAHRQGAPDVGVMPPTPQHSSLYGTGNVKTSHDPTLDIMQEEQAQELGSENASEEVWRGDIDEDNMLRKQWKQAQVEEHATTLRTRGKVHPKSQQIISPKGPLMAGESEGRRSSHTKVADAPASNVPSFGRLRGKALSSTSVGNRSQASIRSDRSDRSEGGASPGKGSVIFAPDGQIIAIGGSITPSRDTESISAVSEANKKEADVVTPGRVRSESSEDQEPVWDQKLPTTASTSKAVSSSRTDANDIDITQSVHKWNYVATSPVQTSHGEQLKPVGAEKGSLKDSRRESHGSVAQPISEQDLVKALTEHAHKIATSVLNRTGTGQDLVNDAQAVIEEFLATAGHNAGGSGSEDDDDYKEMLRERLSSVVSKISGDSVPADAIVSAQLVEALMKQGFEPGDIELVQSESGQSVLHVRGDSGQQPDINELMGGVKPGHIYQVPVRKGKGSAQDSVASPLGPIDIVGYGEGETLHTDEVLETAEKKPPASYISTILDENRAKSTSPAKSIAGKSQVSFKGISSEGDPLGDVTGPSQDDRNETAEGKMAGETVSELGMDVAPGVKKDASAKSTRSAKSVQGASAMSMRSTKSTGSTKSTKSEESRKAKMSGRTREAVGVLSGKAKTKSMTEDRDEFVVGKVADNKELETLYGPVETPARELSSVMQQGKRKSVDKLKMPALPTQQKKGVSKKRSKPVKGKKAKKTSISKETPDVVSHDEQENGASDALETERTPRVESVKDLSSEVSHTPPADDSDEMEFIIIRDEFSDTDDASEENEEERKRIAEEKLQESLRAAQERRRQAEARVDETEPEDEEDTSQIPPEMARELRAAKRAAEANKRRELVERKRREREQQAHKAKEEAERQEQLARELEEERRQREEERRMRKQQREEEERLEEERERERERQLAHAAERERRQKEEYQKRLEMMRRKQAEAERLRKEAEEARRIAAEEEARLEAIKLSEMAEEDRLEYLRRKEIEAEERRLAEEIDRIKREEEARVALEEAKKLAEEMAHKQAELERRLNFNRGLQVESNGLAHTQDVTRAFVFSYFELLQWLGIDISEIELLKMTKF